jgi:hypothetical protein
LRTARNSHVPADRPVGTAEGTGGGTDVAAGTADTVICTGAGMTVETAMTTVTTVTARAMTVATAGVTGRTAASDWTSVETWTVAWNVMEMVIGALTVSTTTAEAAGHAAATEAIIREAVLTVTGDEIAR